ncbi:MAG: sugar nucleotide-binding protein, partial [Thermohalobaculum sp.]|nr:sugar nucleotide-binding protein [Thermohalobaculum sp.]
GVGGVFHFCGAPQTSWHGFSREIFARAPWIRPPVIEPIATADWPTPARRPLNSMLDCTKIAETYGLAQPDWRAGLGPIVAELSGRDR